MTAEVQEILRAFEHLPQNEKAAVVVELLRRTPVIETGPLSDDELVMAAETIFLELNRREAADA